MLWACSQLFGPQAWASTQAETVAFHSPHLSLTIHLPLEHLGPGQMLSGIMTLKGNSSQTALAISDLGASKVFVSSPSNKAPLVEDYSVTSCENMMNHFLQTPLSPCLPWSANLDCCGGLTLAGYPVPTKPFCHFPTST